MDDMDDHVEAAESTELLDNGSTRVRLSEIRHSFGPNQLSCKPLRIPKRGVSWLCPMCHRSPDNLVVFLEAFEVVHKLTPEIKTDSKSSPIDVLHHNNKAMLQYELQTFPDISATRVAIQAERERLVG